MIVRALVDTNLLVYSYDRGDQIKQAQALTVLDDLITSGAGALTTQVLGEFVATVTRKLAISLPLEAALTEAERYLRGWTVFDVTARVVEEAVRGVRAYQFNYWDAQIWAVARLHRIPYVLSEDFSDGAVLENVHFFDPFRPGFRAAELLKS